MNQSLIVTNFQDKINEIKALIKYVEGDSESFCRGSIQRIRFILINDYVISVVKGDGAYAGQRDNTFEMAVIAPNGKLDYTHTEGDVLSYQTIEDLVELIKKVITAPKELPPLSLPGKLE